MEEKKGGEERLIVFKSLEGQAEETNTYESYKEVIEKMRAMTYEEMYDVMRDSAIALKVLCREENTCDIAGLLSLTEEIVKLGVSFLQMNDHTVPIEATITPKWKKPYTGYTYEFIEKQKEEEK